MNKSNLETILDYGSSKIRIGVFDKEFPKNNYFMSENCKTIFKKKKLTFENSEEKILKLIKVIEKKTDTHLNDIDIMFDTTDFTIVDLAIKKKFDGRLVYVDDIKYLLQELNSIIKNNYLNFKIVHFIITRITADDENFDSIPENNLNCKELIIEVKFICLPDIIYNEIITHFKKKFVSINKIYCTSYVKSFSYKEQFKEYKKIFFLDIGFEKSCLTIYEKNKLKLVRFLSIGGNHITKDISRILKIPTEESEEIKKNLYKLITTYSNMNNKKNNLIDLEMFRNINIENRSIEFLKKIIFARVDEIIDLIFNKINFDDFYNKFDENILVFTGEGSKVLNANPEFSNKKFHYFNDINIYEETLDSICESYKKFNFLDNPNEITIVPKKLRKSGLFEKFFDLFR